MQHPLLVSDLDGTLLNAQKQVGERTVAAVNRFVAQGGLFTIATARMPFGCQDRLVALDLRLPAVVMNGAATYSFAAERYLDAFAMDTDTVREVEAAVASAGADAFVYALNSGELSIGYTRPAALTVEQYNSAAAQAWHAPFTELGGNGWDQLGEIVYIAIIGDDDQIARVLVQAQQLTGAKALPYRNIYAGSECLEIASAHAGKDAAITSVRDRLGIDGGGGVRADGLVVFGDNTNDLDMMALADHSFAPSDAIKEAIEAADTILPPHTDDAVAAALERYFPDGVPAGLEG